VGVLCGVGAAFVWDAPPHPRGRPPRSSRPPRSRPPRRFAERVVAEGLGRRPAPCVPRPEWRCARPRVRRGARRRRPGANAARIRPGPGGRQGVRRRHRRLARPVRPLEAWPPTRPWPTPFAARASELLADVEGRGTRDCATARVLGAELVTWVTAFRAVFDEGREAPGLVDDLATAAGAPAFRRRHRHAPRARPRGDAGSQRRRRRTSPRPGGAPLRRRGPRSLLPVPRCGRLGARHPRVRRPRRTCPLSTRTARGRPSTRSPACTRSTSRPDPRSDSGRSPSAPRWA